MGSVTTTDCVSAAPSTLYSTPLSEINSNIEVNWKALTGSEKELVNN